MFIGGGGLSFNQSDQLDVIACLLIRLKVYILSRHDLSKSNYEYDDTHTSLLQWCQTLRIKRIRDECAKDNEYVEIFA